MKPENLQEQEDQIKIMDKSIVRNLSRIVESYIKIAFYNTFGSLIAEQVDFVKESFEEALNKAIAKAVALVLVAILFFWTLGASLFTLFFYFAQEVRLFNAGLATTFTSFVIMLIIGIIGFNKK